jgi:hypothetical protein
MYYYLTIERGLVHFGSEVRKISYKKRTTEKTVISAPMLLLYHSVVIETTMPKKKLTINIVGNCGAQMSFGGVCRPNGVVSNQLG